MPQRYDNVQFEFLSAEDGEKHYWDLRGAVRPTDDGMVLNIEWPDENTSYLIRGKTTGNFFRGRHEGLPGNVEVKAQWTRLDDIYIGVWVEAAREYLFTFRLPAETASR